MDKRATWGLDDVAERLRQHGISPTRQRTEIARVLFSRMTHLSADQILAQVNRRHARASKATIYNTLKLFLEKNLIREILVDPSRVYYDPNTSPHHHMYDTQTGELADLPSEAVRVVGLPRLPAGVVAEGVDIVVRVRRSG
ncbi:MAG: transcriptional repressor [Rhodocyclales bacterium]|nr:transcriptional repressor [Rhodocyclales bacterium]